jgi:hypothetical protein
MVIDWGLDPDLAEHMDPDPQHRAKSPAYHNATVFSPHLQNNT